MRLAALPPDQVLEELEKNDPFGVRRFERRLLYTESSQGSFLRDIRSLFPCPVDRITLPDRRNKKRNFRNGKVFLFFQHLRKAGGTNFCTLAQRNLPKSQVPSYYCMPDYDWKDKKCAGCFSRWTNEEIVENMKAKNHRILGNEWDAFEPERFFDLPAVFATSFRKPLHRALSQFRFECIESRVRRYMHDPNREGAKERKQNLRPCLVLRDLSSIRWPYSSFIVSLPFLFIKGCKISNITEWWSRRKDLTNVYTWTFANEPLRKISIGTSVSDTAKRQEVIGKALDTVSRFHLVLAMEWLAYAPPLIRKVLGFKDVSAVTERVRPHISQHQRNDGQDRNKLGAAGIAKASWTPEEYLSPLEYKTMSEDLALDEILTDAARRMFLERLVCDDM